MIGVTHPQRTTNKEKRKDRTQEGSEKVGGKNGLCCGARKSREESEAGFLFIIFSAAAAAAL